MRSNFLLNGLKLRIHDIFILDGISNQAYNTVKHNRVTEFKKANLRNVLAAIAAVFIVITKGGLCPMDKSKWLHPNGMVSIVDDRNLIMRQSLKRNLRDSAD